MFKYMGGEDKSRKLRVLQEGWSTCLLFPAWGFYPEASGIQ